jgi:starch phosphorylase
VKAIRRFAVHTVLPERLAALDVLATNLRWSWHVETRDLFESIDADLWHSVGRDPVRLLGEVPAARWTELAADEGFVSWVNHLSADLTDYLGTDRWYQTLDAPPKSIAYFSPEFGITSVLPQYSGGLGILAGDHLKAASDLGVVLVGVGLLYRSGYFRQTLSREGWQQEQYPVLDPDGRPVTLLRESDGTPARIVVPVGQMAVAAHIWVAQVGRVPLLLLDTDVEENGPAEREVTDRLYGGGTDHRLQQEMLLGIGGIRAIRTYSKISHFPPPEVYHTNEGHAGFQGLERMRELVIESGLSFDVALETVRAGTVFTTHTPVPAGIDRFPVDLIRTQLAVFANAELPLERLLELGAEDYEGGDPAVFNMAVMGLRLAQRANGVSRLHGRVSREMFAALWPGFDSNEVPIGSITNGVHAPTWVAREVRDLAAENGVGSLFEDATAWSRLGDLPDEGLWWTKRRLRERLVLEARTRVRSSWLARGASEAELGWISQVLDPDVLTIGFARRVPSYKRLTLMLQDPERLKALLLDPVRPVQIVVAGKAHPADDGGKRLIQDLVEFADAEEVRHRIVFLPNYDIGMATVLYPGCDVWLNNPLRPLEACGTSGMKAALNGGLNLSVLDGWWDEWCDGRNGWAIPTADGVSDVERRDALEAAALYDLIEKSVTRAFYDRDDLGIPGRWVGMVRHTLATLGPKVLASRMLQDYVEQLYVPAGVAAREVTAANFAGATELAHWKARVRSGWARVGLEHVEATGLDRNPSIGTPITVRASVRLGDLQPADVQVQLVHGRVDADDRLVNPEVLTLIAGDADGDKWRYEVGLKLARTGPFGYTVRVVPSHVGLRSAAELGLQALPQAAGAVDS